jgi:hypothetical protein
VRVDWAHEPENREKHSGESLLGPCESEEE